MHGLKLLFTSLFVLTILFGLTACGGASDGSNSASSDASLSELIVSAGALSPEFASSTTDYTVTTADDLSIVSVTANQANASVTVIDVESTGAGSSSIDLDPGETVITVTVTSPDGTTTQTYNVNIARVVELELLDPTPRASDRFGSTVVVLENGNIVVTDPYDSSRFGSNGAVHLYSPLSSTPISSLYGDAGGDELGNSSITALPSGHYVIASTRDNENGVINAGSVRLMDGTTGVQIGSSLTGDDFRDYLGSDITLLPNGNYVVTTSSDYENGIAIAGSVYLIDGTTGLQIGNPLVGNVVGDYLGLSGITVLTNSYYVISSELDDENGIVNSGSVRLVNGSTGEQVGSAIVGDIQSDSLGYGGTTALSNGHYVIPTLTDDENGIVNAGSVRLVDGNTGLQIGSALVGDVADDKLGSSGITLLSNGHYVIASSDDDENGIVDAGSVRLVDGNTGLQIGSTLSGDVEDDLLGLNGITALSNGHYVIASFYDDENGIVDAGTVRLVDGNTGVQIGSTLAGDVAEDYLGRSSITALPNENYVIASRYDDENGVINGGSVRLINGTTGLQIGSTLAGDVQDDSLGGTGITALTNNNYVIASQNDNENGIANAGSVRLVDGTTGMQIGSTIAGDVEEDYLGLHYVTVLPNNNYIIKSYYDDENGIVDAGSMRLVSGTTGVQIGSAIVGSAADDMVNAAIIVPETDVYYILAQPGADNSGQVDSGMVRIMLP